ncbi:hypothetical protein CLORY_27530 [Clostridium oryzae]|uniref:Uncharacterized protein n=1 Tax=Clostridium oryzae TaxID=1450648 RepID=A0A1V4IM63_9CLOT|nr:hypothetical protein CLORY_27530 [Clostridium oryzae]
MSRDNIIKEMLPKTVYMTPKGFVADELSLEASVSIVTFF